MPQSETERRGRDGITISILPREPHFHGSRQIELGPNSRHFAAALSDFDIEINIPREPSRPCARVRGTDIRDGEAGRGGIVANPDAGKNGEEVIAREVSLRVDVSHVSRPRDARAATGLRIRITNRTRDAETRFSACCSALYGALCNKSPHRTRRANFRAAVFTRPGFRDRSSQTSDPWREGQGPDRSREMDARAIRGIYPPFRTRFEVPPPPRTRG